MSDPFAQQGIVAEIRDCRRLKSLDLADRLVQDGGGGCDQAGTAPTQQDEATSAPFTPDEFEWDQLVAIVAFTLNGIQATSLRNETTPRFGVEPYQWRQWDRVAANQAAEDRRWLRSSEQGQRSRNFE